METAVETISTTYSTGPVVYGMVEDQACKKTLKRGFHPWNQG
jgi:hypothetical protein